MRKKEIIYWFLISIFLGFLLSPFASQFPDGLEKVAEKLGFLDKQMEKPVIPAPIPDYSFPGIKNEKLATSLAGLVGVVLIFGIGLGIGIILKKKRYIKKPFNKDAT